MKQYPNKRDRGFSLIELMIAVLLGMIVMVGVIDLFSSNVKSSSDMLASARLNQDLSAVMTIMVNDVRRAGYSGGVADFYGRNQGGTIVNAINADLNVINDGTQNCILFSYDRDSSGALTAAEYFGLRHNSGDGSISMRTSCDPTTTANNTSDAASPANPPGNPNNQCFVSCAAGSWERITDPEIVNVTAFNLTTIGSKCINLRDPDEPPDNDAANTDKDKDLDYWEVADTATGADSRKLPCNATTFTGMKYNNYNQSTGVYTATTATTYWEAPEAGEIALENRQINITITASLKKDNTVTKTLSSSVNVRNARLWRF